MRNDPAGDDAGNVWRNQPTGPSPITMEKIRQKTRELHAKTRSQLLRSLAALVIVVVLCGFGLTHVHGPVLRSLFALSIAWSLAGQYFLNRGMRSTALPADAALITGLEFYRREVERRLSLFDRFMLWWFGPVALALVSLVVLLLGLGIEKRGMLPGGALLKMSPFLIALVVWVVIFLVRRMQDQRELRREVNQLHDIERANR